MNSQTIFEILNRLLEAELAALEYSSYYFDSLGQDVEQMATYGRMQDKVNRNSVGLARWLPVTGG